MTKTVCDFCGGSNGSFIKVPHKDAVDLHVGDLAGTLLAPGGGTVGFIIRIRASQFSAKGGADLCRLCLWRAIVDGIDIQSKGIERDSNPSA